MNFDPTNDENKKFSLDEFVTLAKSELDKYANEWRNTDEFFKKPHTWTEWFKDFFNYMSW